MLGYQRCEITEYHIYMHLAKTEKNDANRKVLEDIANAELKHYNFWKRYTGIDIKPNNRTINKYKFLSKLFGMTFSIKLMEKGEKNAQDNYDTLSKFIPDLREVIDDEINHENKLINLLDEERLKYVSSIVLGINDALVELTGALAGFTFALQIPGLIAITALITGIAAAMSMGASEYLSTKSEETDKNPLKASLYTGIAYIISVFLLVFPYFLISNVLIALTWAIGNSVLVILFFTYYISVAKDLNFKKRFLEMVLISLGIAAISFFIGFLINIFISI
ncbi:MAG: rubrerythrin family protein [Candidatus Lokiarchaeota archaeon]|nr:rubrerythrin family protein [Candidatus Lokiarchaeota archaeon]